jgi:HEAT repeat protein
VPQLLALLEQHPDQESEIANAFRYIGPPAKEAVPALLRKTGSTNQALRVICVQALGEIGADPEIVVPALMELLHHPDPSTRGSAVYALGKFGTNASPAVSALTELLKDPDNVVRRDAASELISLDPAAAEKAGLKSKFTKPGEAQPPSPAVAPATTPRK